jgi:cobalt/nickel transport system permease protein
VTVSSGSVSARLEAGSVSRDFFRVLSWMALVHAAIGLGEAIITGLVVRFILLTRPELIDPKPAEEWELSPGRQPGGWLPTILAGLGIALAVAVFLAPFAYDQPDGLQFVGQETGILPEHSPSGPLPAPMPEYRLPLPGWDQVRLATALAGMVGTLIVFAVGWGLARVFAVARPRPQGATPDAA